MVNPTVPLYLKENTAHEDGAICVQCNRERALEYVQMLTVLRYLLLIVTAMLDHFCPEFCLPHSERAAQVTEMVAVSIYRPLDEAQKRANGQSQQSALGLGVGHRWDVVR